MDWPDLNLPWRTHDTEDWKLLDRDGHEVVAVDPTGETDGSNDDRVRRRLMNIVNTFGALPPTALVRTDTLAGLLRAALADRQDTDAVRVLRDALWEEVGEGGPVVWTGNAPTEVGWWWHRNLEMSTDEALMWVYRWHGNDLWSMLRNSGRYAPVHDIAGEWGSRRIRPPESPVRRPGEGT